MASNAVQSRGSSLADRLAQGVRTAANAPLPGARQLSIIQGVAANGACIVPLENVLIRVTSVLANSNRVFVYGDATVVEVDRRDGTGPRLVYLRTGGRVETGAEDWLANLMLCSHKGQQFPLPKAFADVLLRAEPVMDALPKIQIYARRPVFDMDFVLCGPGWHPGAGILVHGPAVDPVLHEPPNADGPALDRLPPRLRELLAGFCFAESADLANTIALLLTGLLVNHVIVETKPLALFDGNQPAIGKTLLARAVGMVLGGTDPPPIRYTTDEEELAKHICATIRGSQHSLLMLDNAKVKGGGVVEGPTIEANSMAPEICLRILGKSENFTRPNDLLWCITMNCTKTSPDIVSRALPIRLAYEGDPKDRAFPSGDPLVYAREHRVEILGEVAGMVIRWTQAGRPEGCRGHRCGHWARLIGGIMEVAGLPEFLANYGEAAAEFNSAADELAALAEVAVLEGEGTVVFDHSNHEGKVTTGQQRGFTAAEWVKHFLRAEVRAEELITTKSSRAKAVKIGQFFAPLVGRETTIQVQGRIGKATLQVETGRANRKRYFFTVRWDEAVPADGGDEVGASSEENVLDDLAADEAVAAEEEASRPAPKTTTQPPEKASTTGATSPHKGRAPRGGAKAASGKGNSEEW